MLGLITGLLSDAVTPLMDSIADFSARLVKKLVLFLVAGLCLLVVLAALTIAFDLWIATLAGPIVAALSVAGLYLAVAGLAVVLALRGGATSPAPVQDGSRQRPASAAPPRDPQADARIDAFAAPLLDLLQRFGFRREQAAVFAGLSIAKRLGPLPLVGCAILAGFLVGRMWKSWRHLLETALAIVPILAEIAALVTPKPADPPPEA